MKILHVINTGYLAGGAEISVLTLRDQQRKSGHGVRVLSTDAPGGELFSDYQVPQISTSGVMRVFQYIFYPRSYAKMRDILREFRPDVIHFHTVALFSPAIFLASRSTPSVLTVHGPEPFTLNLLPWALLPKDYVDGSHDVHKLTRTGFLHYVYFRYLIRPLYRWCLRSVAYFIAPSAYMAQVLKSDVPGNKIVQIYNGIVLPRPAPIRAYNRVLFVGRLENTKGVDYLIDAFARALAALPDLELHIVGDGPHRTDLETHVQKLNLNEKVTFHGWVKSGPEILSAYEEATVLVVPSIWPENLGTVCIEAMAVGRPVIGTNVGGIPEVVADGQTGYLVPIKDSAAIAEKMIALLTDRETLQKMSRQASERAKNFNAETFTGNITALYKRALGRAWRTNARPMNIYYITDELLEGSSVETVHIREVCKNFVALGHTVTLYAPAIKGVSRENFQPTNGYRTNYISTPRFLFSIIFQIKLFLRLRRDIAAHRPDVIYSRHNNLLFVPVIVGKVYGIPTVLEINGQLLDEARLIDTSWTGRTLHWLGASWLIEALNARLATKLIAVAPGIKEYLIRNFNLAPDKISTVRNGVNIDFFKPFDRTEARKKIGIKSDAIYIGYIGSLYRWQGLRHIIKAAQLTLAQRPNARFLIVGKGEEIAYLRSYVAEANLGEAVEIRSSVPHELVPTYINALDICICYPTLFRNSGTSPFKVYEYLSCGKAVVLADIEGMREEFGDALAYAAPESPEALSAALIALVDDEDSRKRLGASACSFVEQGRSWKMVTQQIVSLCASLIR